MSKPTTVPVEQAPLPFYEPEGHRLDRFQRIETLGRLEDGFLPTTLAEQTEVMGLQAVIGKTSGTAKHLSEVIVHQRRADTSDPGRAVRKITRSYADYALDAQARTKELGQLGEELEGANPELVLSRVVGPEQPGILAFLRFFDLSALRDGVKIEKLGYDPQKVDYSPDNGGIMVFAEAAVDSWRVHQVRKRLPEAVSNEASRLTFWLRRLVEVDKHYPMLRPIAREGLDKIYGRTA